MPQSAVAALRFLLLSRGVPLPAVSARLGHADTNVTARKVGFAVSLPEPLRTLGCSALFAKVVRTWPCKMLWERTAIDCVTEGCKQLHTEVFRAQAIEPVVQRCEPFFNLMPKLHDPDK